METARPAVAPKVSAHTRALQLALILPAILQCCVHPALFGLTLFYIIISCGILLAMHRKIGALYVVMCCLLLLHGANTLLNYALWGTTANHYTNSVATQMIRDIRRFYQATGQIPRSMSEIDAKGYSRMSMDCRDAYGAVMYFNIEAGQIQIFTSGLDRVRGNADDHVVAQEPLVK